MDEQPMTKATLLADFRSERAAFSQLFSGLDEAQLQQPGVEADWSVKDIVAHITSWEKALCRWFATVNQGGIPTDFPQTAADVDRMNAAFSAANRDKPLAQVMAEFAAMFDQVEAAITSVPENDLIPPDRFPWREGHPLWYMVGGNTFWHYQEHTETIRKWLAAKNQET